MINTRPRQFYLRLRDPTSIVKDAGWALQPVWTGLDTRTVQPVASCYTDCAFSARRRKARCHILINRGLLVAFRGHFTDTGFVSVVSQAAEGQGQFSGSKSCVEATEDKPNGLCRIGSNGTWVRCPSAALHSGVY